MVKHIQKTAGQIAQEITDILERSGDPDLTVVCRKHKGTPRTLAIITVNARDEDGVRVERMSIAQKHAEPYTASMLLRRLDRNPDAPVGVYDTKNTDYGVGKISFSARPRRVVIHLRG